MKHIISILALILPMLTFAQDYLLPNEQAIYQFESDKGKRLVLAIDSNEAYLVYRYGSEENIELEYPDDLSKSWDRFHYSSYFRGGGTQNAGLDLNYLYFDIGSYQYVVFQSFNARAPEPDQGIKVINTETNKTTTINADPNTVTGTLLKFREMEQIERGDQLFD